VTNDHPHSARDAVAATLAAALVLLLALGGLAWWLLPSHSIIGVDTSVEDAVAWIRSRGAWGVAGSIALMTAHSFLPFPAEVIAIANGMVYGSFWGAVITWTGAMLGATTAYGLVLWLGRPFLHRMLSEHRLRKLEAWSGEHGGMALFIGRLVPLVAFNLLNYGAALAGIRWRTFLWATGIGILPLTIVLSVIGDRAEDLPLWMWVAIGVAVVAGAFAMRRRRWGSRTIPR
jgi:uncharacterized membrane protein YdjX (TVP38/TMEM64 family)